MTKKCPKCGSEEKQESKFCSKCGENIENIQEEKQVLKDMYCPKCKIKKKASSGDKCDTCQTLLTDYQTETNTKEGTAVDKTEFDPSLFLSDEDSYIIKTIKNELKKDSNSRGKTLISIEIRKLIMTIIYAATSFLFLMFYVAYHVALTFTIFLFIIITVIYLVMLRKYNLNSYLLKEVKSRPDEKISNIIASILSAGSGNNSKLLFGLIRLVLIVSIILISTMMFNKPHYIYEKDGNNYVLRYYTLGLFENEKEIKIPKKYKNSEVTEIRGDVFKNVNSIKKVHLPSTLKEIRGGAFKNCHNLEEINIPSSIERIGGEAFMNCWNLKSIKLPEGLDEIHGSTFEECDSLTSINIPDSVRRIGGHAFYGCNSLEKVEITSNSSLTEIGSSAFRLCYNLREITIPRNTYVNERAFKESPTIINYFNEDISEITNEFINKNSYNIKKDEEIPLTVDNKEIIIKYNYTSIGLGDESHSLSIKSTDGSYYTPSFVYIKTKEQYKKLNSNLLLEINNYDQENDILTITLYYN